MQCSPAGQHVPLQHSPRPAHALLHAVVVPEVQTATLPHVSHALPFAGPLIEPQPPQAFFAHVSSHQLSLRSALHCQVPQQPPQPLPSEWLRPPQPPHTLREEAPLHDVAFCPLHT
jgi:hypothetical protein